MLVTSLCPLRVASVPWRMRNGAAAITVVCKGTFDLAPGELRLAEHQEDPNEHENFWDDDPHRSLLSPSDHGLFKMRADVVLVGKAFTPMQAPGRSIAARLTVVGAGGVGVIDKTIEVCGDRTWTPEGGVREGPSFTSMSLRYERAAYGGENPVGVRVDPHAGGALPNLQAPGAGRRPDAILPIGFGPIASQWPARRALLGPKAAAPPRPRLGRATPARRPRRRLLQRRPARSASGSHRPRRPPHPREPQPAAPPPLRHAARRSPARLLRPRQGPRGAEPHLRHALDRHRQRRRHAHVARADGDRRPPRRREGERPPRPPGPRARLGRDPGRARQGRLRAEAAPLRAAPRAERRPHRRPDPGLPDRPRPQGAPLPRSGRAGPRAPRPCPRHAALDERDPAPAADQPRGDERHQDRLEVGLRRPPSLHPPAPAPAPPPPVLSAPLVPAPPLLSALPLPAPPAPVTVGVLSASNLALGAEPAPAPPPQASVGAPARALGRPAPAEIVDLLWFDPAAPDRARLHLPWQDLIVRLHQPPPEADPDDGPEEDPPAVRDRRDLLGVLTEADPTPLEDLDAVLAEATSPTGGLTPPLVLVAGDLVPCFEEVEALGAALAAAAPFAAGGDKKLKEAFEAVTESLKSSWAQGSPRAAEALTTRLREAFPPGAWSLPAGWLDQQIERAVVEKRAYQKRKVLGKTLLRAMLSQRGARWWAGCRVYLAEEVGGALPLYARFGVRVVAEVHLQQDQYEAHPVALRAVALARVGSVGKGTGVAGKGRGRGVQ